MESYRARGSARRSASGAGEGEGGEPESSVVVGHLLSWQRQQVPNHVVPARARAERGRALRAAGVGGADVAG